MAGFKLCYKWRYLQLRIEGQCFRNILEFKFYADLMFPLQTFSLLLTLNFLFAHLTLMQLCASQNILNLFQICIFKLLCSSTSWWRQYTSKVFELWHLFTYAACAHSLPTYTSIFLLAQLLPTLFLHIFSAKKNCSPPQKRTGHTTYGHVPISK